MKYGGETLSSEAATLCQVLLNHQRELVASGKKLPFQDCLITYHDLCDDAGLPFLLEAVNGCLWEIAEFCASNDWPPLNAIVVNARTREPHKSYGRCPGCSLNDWRDQAQAVLEYLYYPDLVKA